MPWSFIKFSQHILWGNVWRSVWRICMWILGLKGLKPLKVEKHIKRITVYPHTQLFQGYSFKRTIRFKFPFLILLQANILSPLGATSIWNILDNNTKHSSSLPWKNISIVSAICNLSVGNLNFCNYIIIYRVGYFFNTLQMFYSLTLLQWNLY